MFRETLDICVRKWGKENPKTLSTMKALADVLDRQRNYAEAEQLLRRAVTTQQRVPGKEHPDTLNSMNSLGWVLLHRGHLQEAQVLFRRTVETAEQGLPPGRWLTSAFRVSWGACLTALARYDVAEAQLAGAYDGLQAALGEPHGQTRSAVKHLVGLYDAWGNPAEAAEWRAKLPAAERAGSLIKLGMRLLEDGRHAGAEAALRECLEIRQATLAEGH